MASYGINAWRKYFAGRDVETTLKEDAKVYDDESTKTVSSILKKGSSIFVPKESKWIDSSKRILVTYDKNKKGFIPFSTINKPLGKKSSNAGLKPSDIKPKIVDIWLDPEEIVKNTKTYVSNLEITDEEKDIIYKLLDKTIENHNQLIDITGLDPEVIPSEFLEILTSVKLVKLLRNGDRNIKKILGLKNIDVSKSKLKIMIPEIANTRLFDYYVSISASNNPTDAVIRVSVKSKIKSKTTNTIKFKDAFKNQQEIDRWYNSLVSSQRSKQDGQKIVAESAVEVPKGKALMYPTSALANLMDKRISLVRIAIDKFKIPNNYRQTTFESAIKTLGRNIASLKRNEHLSDVLKGDELDQFTNFMKANLIKKDDSPVDEISVENASFMCEKILVRVAQEDLKSHDGGLNFYHMFYTQILEEQAIAYAIARKIGGKSNLRLKYDYYSLVNWEQEYGDWVTLRSKNSIGSFKDTLGMDPLER